MMKHFRLMTKTRGMSLVEVMLACSMLGLVTLGVVSYFIYLTRFQLVNRRVDTSIAIQKAFLSHVSNNTAWANTIADTDNVNLACLSDVSIDCSGVSGAVFIMDAGPAGGNVYSDYSDLKGLAGSVPGFTFDGSPCEGFDLASGNEACPFGFTTSWTAFCPASGRCNYPLILVQGELFYKPGRDARKSIQHSATKNQIHRYRSSLQAKYDTVVVHDSVASGNTGGTCTAGAWRVRGNMSEEEDMGANVNITGGNTLTFNPGTYDCVVRGVAYGTGQHKVRLRTTGGTTLIVGTSENTSKNHPMQTESVGYGVFTLTVATAIQISQYCLNTNGALTGLFTGSTFTFGIPSSSGIDEVYSGVSCKKLTDN